MVAKIVDESFKSDLFEVVSNWITYNDAIPERWKEDLKLTGPMLYSDLQVLGTSGCSDLVSRARKAMKRLKPLSDTLRELASAIEAESEAVCTNYNAVSNMCSLIFLPDELLARIFEFVVDGDPGLANSARTKAAVTLSHVSQYFRSTALSCAALWSYVSGSSDLDFLCLSRSKDALLDVEMDVDYMNNPRKLVFERSLVNILPYSGRWRSLGFQFTAGQMHSQRVDVCHAFRGLDLRALESLHFNPHGGSLSLGGFRDFQYLDAPNLRHLTSSRFFPLSFPAFANLTTLSVALPLGHISLAYVHNGLSRMKALESFSLELESGLGSGDDQLHGKLELLRVRQLKFEITNRSGGPIKLGSFFSSMSFPGAVELHLKYLMVNDIELDLEFYELGNILQHDMQFPCVERFCLEVNGLTKWGGSLSFSGVLTNYQLKPPQEDMTVVAPLGLLPSLKHLTLCSNGRMLPCLPRRSTLASSLGADNSTSEMPPEELHIVSSLETVTIRAPTRAVTGMSNFVSEILQMQKKRGDWGEFRELVVADVAQVEGGDTCVTVHSKAYTGDSALEWCEERKSVHCLEKKNIRHRTLLLPYLVHNQRHSFKGALPFWQYHAMLAPPKLDHEILENEMQEVLSSWITCKEATPKHWKDAKPINPMRFSELRGLGATGCTRLGAQARKNVLRLTSLSNTLRELSSAIQAESEAAQENFELVTNMCNLIFLPNELLTHIFHFVINGDPGETHLTRSRAAFTLSHVSQYFRRTTLGCSSLWTNISGRYGTDLLSLLRSRDKLLDVAIVVDIASGEELMFEQSSSDALPHSKRWRSLDVQYVAKCRNSRQIFKWNPKTRQAFQELDLRSLESLRITNTNDADNMFKEYREFQHWNSPNLRHLVSMHYFPLSLPGLANLTSLDVTLKPGHVSLADFLRDLSRMKYLEYFALKLEGDESSVGWQERFKKVEFPRVRRLKIEMESQSPHWADVLKVFFASMSFSYTVDLDVKLVGEVIRLYSEDDEPVLALSGEVESIFRHDMQFPIVERFCLEVNGLNIGAANTLRSMEAQLGTISLPVPLSLLPNVKHFTLRSNGCLNPHHLPKSISGGMCDVPALETITIQIIRWAAKNVAFYVQDLLMKQRVSRDWREFRGLTVEDNSLDKKDSEAAKTYTGDNALEWCIRQKQIGKPSM
ncbi:hypothetical protein SCHPADRAFT_936448 [Schizopora paradoxa]|uniref:F-box domain-containing protein n=1 Tax=Schizopora paradoxa TaxID=27342 RepID=A0A0H2SM72_9AGAM|nr:hypothetical protein SCHPADRAFT_936448 [Schizopora paradoxa]